jgi:hypothetical protein
MGGSGAGEDEGVKSPAEKWFYWILAATLFAIYLPCWVYGELGTLGGGYPYAAWVWLTSVPLALAAVWAFFKALKAHDWI